MRPTRPVFHDKRHRPVHRAIESVFRAANNSAPASECSLCAWISSAVCFEQAVQLLQGDSSREPAIDRRQGGARCRVKRYETLRATLHCRCEIAQFFAARPSVKPCAVWMVGCGFSLRNIRRYLFQNSARSFRPVARQTRAERVSSRSKTAANDSVLLSSPRTESERSR